MTTELNKKQVMLLISVFIVVSTLIAYEPVRHNEFVSYDDDKYITNNSDIKAGITWQSLGRSFTQPHYFMWHPLTTLIHKMNWQLFGPNPLGHHLVSVMFHIVNALLLFWILTNITGTTWPSAFVAAVFALHPLQVEAVAWAAELKTVLSGLFWLLTTAVYIHYTRRPVLRRYILLLLVFGLCIMTKPIVVTLPFILLLLDYWPLERIRRRKTEDRRQSIENTIQKASVGRLITEKIPLLALSIILIVITVIAQQSSSAVYTVEKYSLEHRIANMFNSYISYIGKMIWPSGLAVIYPYSSTSFSDATTVGCIILFVLMLFLSIYFGQRKQYLATGWLWYIGTLVPVTGLIQSGSAAMANRYMYITMVGPLIIVAWGVKDIVANKHRLQIVAAISAAAVLSSSVVFTRMQVGHWQNSLTLFEYALKVTRNNTIAENSYGCALYDEGRMDDAMKHFSNSVRINPEYFDARFNLCKVLVKQKKADEAIACLNELVRKNDNSAEVHYHLALALGMQKRYDEAIQHLTRVLDIDPDYPDGHNKMGLALLVTGRTTEAIENFKEALRTGTRQAEAYYNLGTAYARLGQYGQAIANWTRSAELDPNNVIVLNNLAWTLATVNDPSLQDADKAIGLARRACELTENKKPEQLDTLAAAYAAAGRFEEAVKTAKQAVDIAKGEGLKDQVIEIQSRMELYKTGKRYLQK